MRKTTQKPLLLIYFFFFLTVVTKAQAEKENAWTHKPSFSVSYTDNANFEENSKDEDFFLNLSNSSSYIKKRNLVNFLLNYKAYDKETLNNSFLGRADYFYILKKWDFNAFAGFLSYVNNQPNTSEEGFDYNFLGGSASYIYTFSKRSKLTNTLTYEFRDYHEFEDRKDNIARLNTSWKYFPYSSLEISPYAEIGYAESTFSFYDRSILGTGVTFKNKFPSQKIRLEGNYMHRWRWYEDRELFNSSGQLVSETHIFDSITAGIYKELSKKIEIGSEYSFNKNQSESGQLDYKENLIRLLLNCTI